MLSLRSNLRCVRVLPCGSASACRTAARSRAFSAWSPVRLQETVNTHPDVADCVASEGTLHVVPYFHFRAHAGLQALYENVAGSETPEDLAPFSLVDESVLHTYLTGKGYDGPTIPVTLMTEIQLADKFLSGAALHERLALRDIIAAVFAAVDADGDGEITMEEFAAWAERQDIGIDARKAFTAVDTADVGALKNFGEFKQMILRENIISLAESKDGLEGQLSLPDALLDTVVSMIFDKADMDGDGEISIDEITTVLAAYSIDVNNTVTAGVPIFDTSDGMLEELFEEIDADGNGTICYQEFKTFLLTEGVVTVTGSSSESMDGGENGFFGTVVFVKAEK